VVPVVNDPRGPASGGQALAIGRILRALLGLFLIVSIAPVYTGNDWRFGGAALGIAVGLGVFYTMVHGVLSRRLRRLPGWLGALVALAPLVVLYVLGTGGQLVFGRGEGQAGVLTFLGVSLVLAGWRGDGGCEVLAVPNVVFGRRTHLPCLFFLPIDWIDRALVRRRS